jgi:hypothetical protein
MWGGLASGALILLAVGGAVAYFGPRLLSKVKEGITAAARDGWGSLSSGAKRLLEAPGEALGYVRESADYGRDPDRDAKATDPTTGATYSTPFKTEGKTAGQLQREQAAAEEKRRAAEARSATIERLQAQKRLIEASGQDFIVDLAAGGKRVTLSDVNAGLAALGVN